MFNHLIIPASMLSDAEKLLGNTNSDFGLTPQLASVVDEIMPDYHACMLREDRQNLLEQTFLAVATDKSDEKMFRSFCNAVEYGSKKGTIDERVMAKPRGNESQATKAGLRVVSKSEVNDDHTTTTRNRQFKPRATASDKAKAKTAYDGAGGLATKEAVKAASRKTNTGGYPNSHPTTKESTEDVGQELTDLLNSLSDVERIECIDSLSEEQLLALDTFLNNHEDNSQ